MNMVRTQIQLTEEQAQALKALAARDGVSMAALVRRGVDRVLAESDEDAKWARALALVGKFRSGTTDVARRHDDYLAEDFAD